PPFPTTRARAPPGTVVLAHPGAFSARDLVGRPGCLDRLHGGARALVVGGRVDLRPRARLAAGPDRGGTRGARRRCLPPDGTDVAVLRGPMTRLGRSGHW